MAFRMSHAESGICTDHDCPLKDQLFLSRGHMTKKRSTGSNVVCLGAARGLC
jgi:hypothetical protein